MRPLPNLLVRDRAGVAQGKAWKGRAKREAMLKADLEEGNWKG